MMTLKFFCRDGFLQHIHNFRDNKLDEKAVEYVLEFFKATGGYVVILKDDCSFCCPARSLKEFKDKFEKTVNSKGEQNA